MRRRTALVFFLGAASGGAIVAGALLVIKPSIEVKLTLTSRGESASSQSANSDPIQGDPDYSLDGFCPVTLIEERRWRRGDSRWAETRGSQTFLFASAAKQQAFQQDAERYMPVFEGNDVVLNQDEGSIVLGHRSHGVYYRSRVYLFASERTLDIFSADPESYAKGVIFPDHTVSCHCASHPPHFGRAGSSEVVVAEHAPPDLPTHDEATPTDK